MQSSHRSDTVKKMTRPDKSRYRFMMVGAVLLVLVNTWVASHALGTLLGAQHWLTHTLEVLTETEELNLQMSGANSQARAYLLTADPQFQTRYDKSAAAIHEGMNKVGALTADNASQRVRIAYLRSRVSVKLGAIDAAMAMSRGNDGGRLDRSILYAAIAESPDGGPSPKYVITQIEEEEQRLMAQRTEESRAARRNVVLSFGVASLFDLILILLAFRYLIRTKEDQLRALAAAATIAALNGELQGLNADLEGRVAQRTRELEVSNKELEAFSYSVSHDLRAPLRTIDGFSLALEEDFADKLNDEGKDYIKRVRNGVQRMGSLIDALLQLSRVTRGEVVRERIDMTSLATLVFNEIHGLTPERHVTFVAQPDVFANADRGLMRVTFENLIGNAYKFTSKMEDARIEFGCEAATPGAGIENGHAVYFIRDNGAGFDMQYVDRLFTAFQRLHGDRDFKGSGIGLATVSRVVRRHHGDIRAESVVGQGATFYFTLEA